MGAMPAPAGRLTPSDVYRYVGEHCLAPGGGHRVGVEVEWFVHTSNSTPGRVPLPELQAVIEAIGPLPGGGRITYEPGGQLELSSPPQYGPAAACANSTTDILTLRPRLAAAGMSLFAAGLHPVWTPDRMLHAPRYDAMEAYFDTVAARDAGDPEWGSAGRTMMCCTSSVQVNVDFGDDPAASWRLAHDLGPVLVAAFANSPLARGRPTGYRSTRAANWWALDPGRTRPISAGGDPVAEIADYALAARVMMIRDASGGHPRAPGENGGFEAVLSDLPFGCWLADGYDGHRPTEADLAYHLTTLFPPIRPRGWLELRMIDALPSPWWQAPVAVAAALLGPRAADAVRGGGLSTAAGLWEEAARDGLRHPTVGGAARRSFDLAAQILESNATERPLAAVVRAYADQYVNRGRCPADDLLDAWRRNGDRLLGDEVEAAS